MFLAKFDLAEHILNELDHIRELTMMGQIRLGRVALRNPHREMYLAILENLEEIEESLREIDLVSGDLVKEINQLPQEERREVYELMEIIEVPEGYEGMSDQLKGVLYHLLEEIEGFRRKNRI